MHRCLGIEGQTIEVEDEGANGGSSSRDRVDGANGPGAL
jgi:hypothetical protein